MIDVARIVTGPWKENCYVVSCDTHDAVVVDPGGELSQIRDHVAAAGLRVQAVLNTHAHYDHLGAVASVVEEYAAPFHLHPADADLLVRANFYRVLFLGDEPIRIPSVDIELADGDTLFFGVLEVGVLHTPGHTPGSVCFEIAGAVFTGDTLMARHLGRTDLPGGDREQLLSSVRLLGERHAPHTLLYPGHGPSVRLGDVATDCAALPELRG